MIKPIYLLLVSAALLGSAPPARAADLLEKIVAAVLADRFGIDAKEVISLRTGSKGSWDDLTPTFSLGHYGGTKASTVWKLRQSGIGWGQVAHKIGMHPGTFNKLRQQGYFDPKPVWGDIFNRRFGTKADQISVIQGAGAKLEDVLAAVVLSKLSGKTPQQMYDQYKVVKDWNTVASKSKVDLKDWQKVAKPVDWEAVASLSAKPEKSKGGPPAGKGKGKGKGKGGGG